MSKNTSPLKLPQSIKRAAERLAKEDGVPLNQWISAAVAQKVVGGGDGDRTATQPGWSSAARGPQETPRGSASGPADVR